MAGFSWAMLIPILSSIVSPLLGIISPVIKTELTVFLQGLYTKALATSSPWDDFFVGLLLDILVIPRPGSPSA